MYIKEMEICPAYVYKINSNCEKQIILLMISNEEKEGWHKKNLPAFIRGITSKSISDSLTWIVFILLEQKIKLTAMKKCVNIKIFLKLYYHLKKIIY